MNIIFHYYVIFTARRYASAVYAVVVCLSVRLSVCDTPVLSIKTAKRRITQTAPSPGTLVSRRQRYMRIFDAVIPSGGAKWRCGRFKSAIFDPYLAISQKRCHIVTMEG